MALVVQLHTQTIRSEIFFAKKEAIASKQRQHISFVDVGKNMEKMEKKSLACSE